MYLELKGGWVGGSQTSILILFIFGIYRAFYQWCEIVVKFCPANTEILQLTDV